MDDFELEWQNLEKKATMASNPNICSWNDREKQLHWVADESLG
jgi:hypothetical protein